MYKLSVKKNRKLENVSFDTLPVTAAVENTAAVTTVIELSTDFKKFSFKRNSDFTGHFKVDELTNRLFFGDYMNEEFKRYGTGHFYKCKKRQAKAGVRIENKMKSLMSSFRKQHEEKLNNSVNNEFDVTPTDYAYEIKDAARYSNKPLSITESFAIEDEFVKKAGTNFIVEVGRFIGGQVQITEEEKIRKLGIYIDHAKTFDNTLSIKIPEGYEVVGLDKLNKNVSNSTGSFVSTGTVKNGSLVYTAKKVYAKRKYQANEWSQMLPWLDAAYQFSQVKVLFKKL